MNFFQIQRETVVQQDSCSVVQQESPSSMMSNSDFTQDELASEHLVAAELSQILEVNKA